MAEQSGGGQQEPVETQDEGINTVDDGGLAAEPSVIGTYTETQPGEVEAAVQEQQVRRRCDHRRCFCCHHVNGALGRHHRLVACPS